MNGGISVTKSEGNRVIYLFLSGVIGAVAALLMTSLFGGATPATLQASHYDRVLDRGEIRASYAVGAPYFIVDPNTGEQSGIFHDVVAEVGKRLGLKVSWTEQVGYGEMIEGLRAGRYDVMGSGVWMNSARGKGAEFSLPVLYDAVLPYVRSQDTRFDGDIQQLNSDNFSISTMDGEMAAAIANSDFPKAKKLAIPQASDFTQMILNVVNNKADITFLGVGPARQFQAKNPGQIKGLNPERPIRIFPAGILLPKGSFSLKSAIDSAIVEMLNNGDIERIIRKYEATPGSHYRVAPSFADLNSN